MSSGAGVWFAVGGPLCAMLALIRSLIARMSALETGFDIRHRLGESARRLAVVSLVYASGIVVLDLVTLFFIRG